MPGNIIGEVFDPFVQEQINNRQIQLSLGINQNTTTTDSVTLWKQNNSAWVRMISSVDVSSTKIEQLGLSQEYVGEKLAQNYILYNGVSSYTGSTLNPASNNNEYFINTLSPTLKYSYGFGSKNGLNQGIRPMPGIESVKVGYINKGFLAQAEIEITAFNREQLYILDALFMHPGYSFLLEWGHTRYIDNNTLEIIHNTNTITEPFSKLLKKSTSEETQYTILSAIKTERQKRSGNYDGFFGIVKNFRYSYQPNGTYKITIIAINQGDIIESLKINAVDPEKAISETQRNQDIQDRQAKLKVLEDQEAEAKRFFKNGKIDPQDPELIQYATLNLQSNGYYSSPRDPKFSAQSGYVYKTFSDGQEQQYTTSNAAKSLATELAQTFTTRLNEIQSIKDTITGENSLANNTTDRYAGKSKLNKQLKQWKDSLNQKGTKNNDLIGIKLNPIEGNAGVNTNNTQQNIAPTSIDPNLYYVRLKTLLDFIQNNVLIYNKSIQVPYFKIDTSDKNYCLHFPKQISANPQVCIIPVLDGKADRKSFEKYKENSLSIPQYSYDLKTNQIIQTSNTNPTSSVPTSSANIFYGTLPASFIEPTGATVEISTSGPNSFIVSSYLGNIMNIFVNLDYAAQVTNNNIDSKGNLTLITFLNELMKGISASLGYINNFEVAYDREENSVKIYDNNILAYKNKKQKGKETSLFVVNGFENLPLENENRLFGSFIEEVNFTSELSNNFSNMITIASQTDTNVLGMDVTGLQRFNEGLVDRIIPKKQSKDEINNNGDGLSEQDLSKMLGSAVQFADLFYNQFKISENDIDIFMSLNRDIANYYVNKDVKEGIIPSPLVIPFNLSMTMMGLSGMRIYERFNVDQKILPPMFDNNGYNFITKALSHEIRNNKWITTLESQVINKEDPNVPDIPISAEQIKKIESTIANNEIKGCPSWTPIQGSTPSVLTPNQVILDSLKEAGYTTTATLESFKKDAPSNIKLAVIIATQEGYGSKSTLGYKNNNPGNIVGKGNNGSVIKTVTRGKSPKTYEYAKYKTKKDGWDALINKYVKGWINQGNLLPYVGCVVYPDCFKVTDNNYFKSVNIPYQEGIQYNYKAKEIPTLRQYLYQFCPPSAEGQDSTNGYIANVYTSLKSFRVNITSIDEPMTNYIK